MTANPVRVSAKLLDIRDTYRRLSSAAHDGWPSPSIVRLMYAIRERATEKGMPPLETAIGLAKRAEIEGQTYIALAILAAAVEIVDPAEAAP